MKWRIKVGEKIAKGPSFKTDESFLEKIAIGAIGTKAVHADLASSGHRPLELERCSTSYKLWKNTKIKRIRVPDILCIECGTKVESRAKTTMEVSMSHSLSDPERGWDKNLSDEDSVAFIVCRRSGPTPVDWQPEGSIVYSSVKDMRQARKEGKTVITSPKGSQEGSEIRVIWPSLFASNSGTITYLQEGRLQFRREKDERIITTRLTKQGIEMTPLVAVGDRVVEGQPLASVIRLTPHLPAHQEIDIREYGSRLCSSSPGERYAAAKALGVLYDDTVASLLLGRIEDAQEHIYIRLESAASLARNSRGEGWEFIIQTLRSDFLQNRLETVIILSEIGGRRACDLLCQVLVDRGQHVDIRSGAAWALGEICDAESIDALIGSFSDLSMEIRGEAAKALARLARRSCGPILERMPMSDLDGRAGIAWALSRAENAEVGNLIGVLVDDDARRWVSFIVGSRRDALWADGLDDLRVRDPEVYFAATVLWKIMASWTYGLEEYG